MAQITKFNINVKLTEQTKKVLRLHKEVLDSVVPLFQQKSMLGRPIGFLDLRKVLVVDDLELKPLVEYSILQVLGEYRRLKQSYRDTDLENQFCVNSNIINFDPQVIRFPEL